MITNWRLSNVSEAKDGSKYIYDTISKLVTSFIASTVWSPSGGSEFQSLFDREGREVNVIFRAVLDVPTVPTTDFCRRDRIVKYIPMGTMIFFPPVGKSLEKSRASRPRPSKYN